MHVYEYVFILKENSLIIEALASESETNTMFNKILSQNIGENNAPKIKVLKGVKEVKIETIELSIAVKVYENKKPGMKVPKSAV